MNLVYLFRHNSQIAGISVNEYNIPHILTAAKPDYARKGPRISERCDHHQRRHEGLGHVAP